MLLASEDWEPLTGPDAVSSAATKAAGPSIKPLIPRPPLMSLDKGFAAAHRDTSALRREPLSTVNCGIKPCGRCFSSKQDLHICCKPPSSMHRNISIAHEVPTDAGSCQGPERLSSCLRLAVGHLLWALTSLLPLLPESAFLPVGPGCWSVVLTQTLSAAAASA